MKKKVLIFGPISDFGGREVEAGFIAFQLSTKYKVDICSTKTFGKKSQVYDFNKNQNSFTIFDLILQKYFILKIAACFSYLKSNRKDYWKGFVSNYFSKKYLGYYLKLNKAFQVLIPKYDLIFICAQLSSSHLDEVLSIAKENHIKVIFRTTGTIHFSQYEYINKVDLFIHHSKSNAGKMDYLGKNNFEIIDQCAFNEEKLFQVPISTQPIRKFLILSRLSPEKGVEQAIDFFLACKSSDDILYVAGNGSIEGELRTKYSKEKSIRFIGFVKSSAIDSIFSKTDCLIIPSPEESGPLVGIEAMCAGKIIISTKVGAMAERLDSTRNNFWFTYADFDSFKNVFLNVKSLGETEVIEISKSLKSKYKEEYSFEIIGEKYKEMVAKVLNSCA